MAVKINLMYVLCVCILALLVSISSLEKVNLKKQRLSQSNVAAGSKSAKVDLSQSIAYYWTISGTLGTPFQGLDFLLDTERSETWVVTPDCQTAYCQSRASYDNTISSSYGEPTGKIVTIKYRDGSSVAGQQGTETLKIGELTIENMKVLFATKTVKFTNESYDGIIGLGLSKSNAQNPIQKSKLETFSFFFNTDYNTGTAYFGEIDSTLDYETINYLKLSTSNVWSFKSNNVRLTTSQTGNLVLFRKPIEVRIDIGYPYIGLPKAAFSKLIKKLNANYDSQVKLYSVTCTLLQSSFLISFKTGSYTFQVLPSTFIISDDSGSCYLSIVSISQSYIIAGVPFAANFYTVFDVKNKKLGLAQIGSGSSDPTDEE